MDLIQRIIYLESLGQNLPKLRVYKWLNNSENENYAEFRVENENYYWKIISSKEFNDIIEENETNWLFIKSENEKLKMLGKIRKGFENLIGENNEIYFSTIWILKSDFESLRIDEKPVQIFSPYNFRSKIENIEYELKKLILSIRNPKIKITEFVDYKISKELTRRIR